ncbi:SRPBCC family protein [Jiangella rhizosphaerae]|uniref:SRPBCC domain-containing protein n=1 Tax=Jiangella rhizosphaerae TaxID=2293569 RepID=A0A418KUS7_9ACTN|nr:SRPBCC domain-containing protein [Jiangella rhizosphaerae]RIQ33649.1 SRPBCC domain-containing protein [Jiangella rhizosphaerae]
MEHATSTTNTTNTTRAEGGYSTAYTVEQSPEEVFAAVLNVRAWWTGRIEGRADELGAEFTYRHPPQHYSVQQVVELEPGRRVVWRVTDSHLAFTAEPAEWTGTEIVFDIVPAAAGGAELRFTHVGLVPDVECFGACSAAWLHYVNGSLRSLISTGTGLPDPW